LGLAVDENVRKVITLNDQSLAKKNAAHPEVNFVPSNVYQFVFVMPSLSGLNCSFILMLSLTFSI
jgi:hypothetical protein